MTEVSPFLSFFLSFFLFFVFCFFVCLFVFSRLYQLWIVKVTTFIRRRRTYIICIISWIADIVGKIRLREQRQARTMGELFSEKLHRWQKINQDVINIRMWYQYLLNFLPDPLLFAILLQRLAHPVLSTKYFCSQHLVFNSINFIFQTLLCTNWPDTEVWWFPDRQNHFYGLHALTFGS